MTRLFILLLAAAWAGPPAAGAAPMSSELNRAAALYHQSRYDSSLAVLEALLTRADAQRRDSLAILQYLGMGRSRVGEDSEARSRFAELLALDSLFRLPRNEDPGILANFESALAGARSGEPASGQGPLSEAIAEPSRNMLHPAPDDPLLALAPARAADARPFQGPDERDGNVNAGGGASRTGMSLAMGAIPLGGGWIARRRMGHGLTLGLLQAGGILLAAHASGVQSRAENDPFGLEEREKDRILQWQTVQRLSLGTAAGAYLYSLIAAGGD
jgi:hypothetical protein